MDFFDAKKRRAHTARLFIGYGLMAIALIISTWLLVLVVTKGYVLDPRTGVVVQNGLVFVDAHPETATIVVDNKPQGQTSSRLSLPAGPHAVSLRRDGYREWQHKIDLMGGSVERLVYPFLFPVALTSSDVEIYGGNPGMVTVSPDRRWMLVQLSGSLTDFELIDIVAKPANIIPLKLPEGLFGPQAVWNALQAVEWASDNRRLLLKMSSPAGVQFAVIDRETPERSFNLNKTFNLNLAEARLRDKHADTFYLLESEGGVLRSADARSPAQLPPLATQVKAFQPHGANIVLFVSGEQSAVGRASLRLREGDVVYTIRDFPASDRYLLDITQFEGRWYMGAAAAAEKKLYLYRDLFSALHQQPTKTPQPISVLKVDDPRYLSFSSNARFLALQGGSQFAVYDAETNSQYRYDTRLAVSAEQRAGWMDGHRLTLVSDGRVVVFDFDGTNLQRLSEAAVPSGAMFNRDYDALFTIAPSRQVAVKPALIRTELRAARR